MTTNAEILREILAFRSAMKKLMARFPGVKHMGSTEILGGQAALLTATMGSFAAQVAIAHILDHDGYSCAAGIIEGVGGEVERETRACFEKIAEIRGLDLDKNKTTAFRKAKASRIIRIGDTITDADLIEAIDEELATRSPGEEEEEEDVNTTTRNDILRMIKETEERNG